MEYQPERARAPEVGGAMSTGWRVPNPSSSLTVPMADGAAVTIRRHGRQDGPRLLFSHGCGFAADLYLPYWSLLLDRFDLLVFDIRSHGWNPVSERRKQNFPSFVSDLGAILGAVADEYGPKPAAGVFHSVSALAALLFEQFHGGFTGLVLFDPPIRPPGGLPEDNEPIGRHMSASTLQRPAWFETREDFVLSVAHNPVFGRLRSGVAELMAETLLRPAQGGGYELCCPPGYEAQVYEYAFGWAMQLELDEVSCPVKVIGSDPTTAFSFMPSLDLSELTELGYDFLPETTHMLPLEEPEQCAHLTVEFLQLHNLA